MIFADMSYYAKTRYDIDLTVTATTSTIEEDKRLGRISSAHRECRAIDIRSPENDWVTQGIISYIEGKKEYQRFKYLSHTGEHKLIHWHDSGHGDHLHLAIHSQFSLIK